MIVLTHEDVADLLPMAEAVEVIDRVMRTVSRGGAELPLRHVVPVGGGNMMGVMSGALEAPHCYGVKLVSLFPGNPEKGLSSHRGAVVLFDELECLANACEHSEPQHIHFQNPKSVEIILIPFNDCASCHGRRADRAQMIKPPTRNHKATNMLR